jgi:hypothetical protein
MVEEDRDPCAWKNDLLFVAVLGRILGKSIDQIIEHAGPRITLEMEEIENVFRYGVAAGRNFQREGIGT